MKINTNMPLKSSQQALRRASSRQSVNAEGIYMSDAPAILPRDQDEEDLEKLVFGDLTGVRGQLRDGTWKALASGHLHDGEADDKDQGESEIEKDRAIDVDEERQRADALAALADDQLFTVDVGPSAVSVQDEEATVDLPQPLTANGEDGVERAPAWLDSDDEKILISLASHRSARKLRDIETDDYITGNEYSRRLRRQFERMFPIPDWALPLKPAIRRHRSSSASDNLSDSAEYGASSLFAPALGAFLQSTDCHVVKGCQPKLRPEILNISRLPDANHQATSFSAIQALQFHPTHSLLLTAGLDSTIRLYYIDGKNNPQATSLHIRGTPIYCARFHADGARVFVGGRRRYFHVWSLLSGAVDRVTRVYGHQDMQKSMEKFFLSPNGQYLALVGARGNVQILDAETTQWISSAKVEGHVADVSWHPDSSRISIANTHGQIFEYAMSTKSFSSVWNDEGGVSTIVIRNSPNGRWVAVGSGSGVVNLYDRHLCFGGNSPGAMGTKQHPKPVRALENLVTSINVIEFRQDSQIMAIASREKKDALRMVHLPSATVFKNWPTSNTPLGRVTRVAFAAGKENGFVAIGNEAGRVRMFDIR